MNESYIYEIRIEGHITDRWVDWFEGLAIRNDPNGETTLSGKLADQAALLGFLNKIQGLNLVLISVNRSYRKDIQIEELPPCRNTTLPDAGTSTG